MENLRKALRLRRLWNQIIETHAARTPDTCQGIFSELAGDLGRAEPQVAWIDTVCMDAPEMALVREAIAFCVAFGADDDVITTVALYDPGENRMSTFMNVQAETPRWLEDYLDERLAELASRRKPG